MSQQDSLKLFGEEETYIKGRHLVTIFHNEENLYTVVRIRVDETNDSYEDKEAVVTGNFPKIHEDETYVFYGRFQEHPRFGMQFHAKHFKKEIPQTTQGVVHYLSSDLFKGIGKKTAEKIVEHIGENAIGKILENPGLLDEIPKLPKEKAKSIYDTLSEHQGLERVMIMLNDMGFGPQISMRVYQAYKEQALEIIQNNPYKLVEDIEGIGFTGIMLTLLAIVAGEDWTDRQPPGPNQSGLFIYIGTNVRQAGPCILGSRRADCNGEGTAREESA